ncbi:hypothetical protein [Algisphaera agarilytica]|uniref:Uncharacterized protein n=1 Tax=Algisphaera agarilytica TaxID=1385975 RepID=A0A7X0LJX3_9BACT|nr:hypothetical protein [Algisphaera agarilytica]MBB6429224.1 hypothetical protein [Algisphaera agarilytica]
MPDSVYLIDNDPVNDRQDWTNRPAVSATGPVRQEAFPGSGITYTMTGPKRGARVIVEGWLEAETSAALRALVEEQDDLRFDAATHAVEILGTTYNDCQLAEPLRVVGDPVPFVAVGNSNRMRQKVRYVWQQLSAEGGTTS